MCWGTLFCGINTIAAFGRRGDLFSFNLFGEPDEHTVKSAHSLWSSTYWDAGINFCCLHRCLSAVLYVVPIHGILPSAWIWCGILPWFNEARFGLGCKTKKKNSMYWLSVSDIILWLVSVADVSIISRARWERHDCSGGEWGWGTGLSPSAFTAIWPACILLPWYHDTTHWQPHRPDSSVTT